MTDEAPKVEPLLIRVDMINEAVRQLSAMAYKATIDSGKPKDDEDKAEIIETIQSIGLLFGAVVVSLTEIASYVGKLARQNDADYKAAVDAAAEIKASVIHEEENKRSFIGQPKRNG